MRLPEYKFREAKSTPKKNGQFVTLWKRNNNNQTAPFHVTDDLDFYMIAARKEHLSGFFLFPKLVLSEHQILTSGDQQRKRGSGYMLDGIFRKTGRPKKQKPGKQNISPT
ncbi:MAG TPA: MepB family protein [Niabella sp.]